MALITGASRGIGYELALNLTSRKDADISVIAVARSEADLKHLQSHSPDKIQIISADLSTENDRHKLIETISCQKIQLNYIVHNAALVAPIGPIQNASETDIFFYYYFLFPA